MNGLTLGHFLLAAAALELLLAFVTGIVMMRRAGRDPAGRRSALLVIGAGIAVAFLLFAIATFADVAQTRLG
jgi:hypothetical protein